MNRRFGVAILAGGRATRFPGKLTVPAGDRAMVARVLANVRAASDEIVVATSAALAQEVRALVDVPVVVDSEEARGPVGGMLAAFAAMRSSPIFAVAGDAPFIDAAFARWLGAAWRTGDEALVPVHAAKAGGEPRSEPLAALYDRDAFLHAGTKVVREGRGALRLVIERLATRVIRADVEPHFFTNVNTPEDYAAFLARLAQENP